MRTLPRRVLFLFSDGVAHAGFYLLYSFRKRSIKNLTVALGDSLGAQEIAETARKSLQNFFRDFIEIGISMESTPETIRSEIALFGREHLERALAKGKGVVGVSAHLGNFFLLGTRLGLEGYPAQVLIKEAFPGRFAELRARYIEKSRQKMISAWSRRQASRDVVQVLRNNEVAIVVADEYRGSDGIPVPFFGRTVLARRGAVTLALRTGAAVLPMILTRDAEGRLTLTIESEIQMVKSGHIEADVRENVLRITQWLERVVRAYPDQWNWMPVRWQPAEGPTITKAPRVEKVAQ